MIDVSLGVLLTLYLQEEPFSVAAVWIEYVPSKVVFVSCLINLEHVLPVNVGLIVVAGEGCISFEEKHFASVHPAARFLYCATGPNYAPQCFVDSRLFQTKGYISTPYYFSNAQIVIVPSPINLTFSCNLK